MIQKSSKKWLIAEQLITYQVLFTFLFSQVQVVQAQVKPRTQPDQRASSREKTYWFPNNEGQCEKRTINQIQEEIASYSGKSAGPTCSSAGPEHSVVPDVVLDKAILAGGLAGEDKVKSSQSEHEEKSKFKEETPLEEKSSHDPLKLALNFVEAGGHKELGQIELDEKMIDFVQKVHNLENSLLGIESKDLPSKKVTALKTAGEVLFVEGPIGSTLHAAGHAISKARAKPASVDPEAKKSAESTPDPILIESMLPTHIMKVRLAKGTQGAVMVSMGALALSASIATTPFGGAGGIPFQAVGISAEIGGKAYVGRNLKKDHKRKEKLRRVLSTALEEKDSSPDSKGIPHQGHSHVVGHYFPSKMATMDGVIDGHLEATHVATEELVHHFGEQVAEQSGEVAGNLAIGLTKWIPYYGGYYLSAKGAKAIYEAVTGRDEFAGPLLGLEFLNKNLILKSLAASDVKLKQGLSAGLDQLKQNSSPKALKEDDLVEFLDDQIKPICEARAWIANTEKRTKQLFTKREGQLKDAWHAGEIEKHDRLNQRISSILSRFGKENEAIISARQEGTFKKKNDALKSEIHNLHQRFADEASLSKKEEYSEFLFNTYNRALALHQEIRAKFTQGYQAPKSPLSKDYSDYQSTLFFPQDDGGTLQMNVLDYNKLKNHLKESVGDEDYLREKHKLLKKTLEAQIKHLQKENEQSLKVLLSSSADPEVDVELEIETLKDRYQSIEDRLKAIKESYQGRGKAISHKKQRTQELEAVLDAAHILRQELTAKKKQLELEPSQSQADDDQT